MGKEFDDEIWNKVKERIRTEFEVADIAYRTWIEGLDYYIEDESCFNIVVPEVLGKPGLNYVMKKYKMPFIVTIEELCGQEYQIEFVLDSSDNMKRMIKARPDISLISQDTNLSSKLNFENFVVGGNSAFAHASALAVAESPGEIYNPLYIYGGPGIGKTHLMHAIGNYIVKNDSSKKVLYVTSEDFTNEIINAIRNGNVSSVANFRTKYRGVDVLLIDDIEFIAGKQSTQEEFFYTFNELQSKGKQIVITSDKPPRDLDDIEDRMKSRFAMGLTADIGLPNYETKMAILRKQSDESGVELQAEILDYMAKHISTSIRELLGAFHKLEAYVTLVNQPLTYDNAVEILDSIITPEEAKKITGKDILELVSAQFNVPVEKLIGKGRERQINIARQTVMYLCKEYTDMNYTQIGALLGNRNHATIIHGVDSLRDAYEIDNALKTKIDVIRKML